LVTFVAVDVVEVVVVDPAAFLVPWLVVEGVGFG
jgi:hypothetical protein